MRLSSLSPEQTRCMLLAPAGDMSLKSVEYSSDRFYKRTVNSPTYNRFIKSLKPQPGMGPKRRRELAAAAAVERARSDDRELVAALEDFDVQ